LKPHRIFTRAVVSWLLVLAWTLLVVTALLKPGDTTIYHKLSLSSFLSTFFNFSLEQYKFGEAAVHVVLFGILTALWLWVLNHYFMRGRAILAATGIAVMIAISTEIGQYFVNRGALFLDLVANFIGMLLILGWAVRKGISNKTA
jgi:VanZ family protein